MNPAVIHTGTHPAVPHPEPEVEAHYGDGPVGPITSPPGPLGSQPSTRCAVCRDRFPARVMVLRGTADRETGLWYVCPDHARTAGGPA